MMDLSSEPELLVRAPVRHDLRNLARGPQPFGAHALSTRRTTMSSSRPIHVFQPTILLSDRLIMDMDERSVRVLPPILRNKHHGLPSAFTPESLLREARRQKGIPNAPVPEICILDPDGDIVRYLRAAGRGKPVTGWACYHSTMDRFDEGSREYGIVGCVVGAPFAVLVAEQLFASGCRLLLSITSSGQVTMLGSPPYFILIERALRDEGTSYHYLPADFEYAAADPDLLEIAESALANVGDRVERGATWTIDAPYRETLEAIDAARNEGILAVEMEAAALYAFANARRKSVLCFAHVTNQMGQSGDFEKGEANGATASLALLRAVAEAYLDARA
jgi:uridine phosphorylase